MSPSGQASYGEVSRLEAGAVRLISPVEYFFFIAPSPPEIYTLSLHDALPILRVDALRLHRRGLHELDRLQLLVNRALQFAVTAADGCAVMKSASSQSLHQPCEYHAGD